MKRERWEEVEWLYHAALEREPAARAAFLDEACAGDAELRREVAELLAYDELESSFIKAPAIHIAARALAAQPLSASQTKADTVPPLVRQIGAYELLEPLGRGGMGEVHLALDTRLGRKVAVKLLPAEFTTQPERVRRFAQEAHAASALNHPNIITIYEIGEIEATHYIVTEYVEGETLRERLQGAPQRRLKPAEAVEIASQIAAALAAAHDAGITHRDIKPENVMVRRDGIVKVLDFGLAKLTESSVPGSVRRELTAAHVSTETGLVMGTPRYMSTEQARGEKVDARSDIFSLGVLIYEMLTGQAPFAGATTSDLIAAILKDEPRPLIAHTPDAPPELERIVGQALRKNREERYQSASALLSELKQLQHDLEFASEEKKRSGRSRAAGRTENKRRRAAIVALAGVTLAATVAWFYYNHRPALTEKDTILLADFENKTGEEIFDGMLKQGLAIQLQQTPFLTLLPETQMRYQLTLMKRPPNERVTAELAREICVRENLKAFITGSIAPLGNHYVITLTALNGQSGAELARVQEQAEGREQVLRALSQAATGLREQLGESLSSLRQFSYHFEEATTAKLEAFKFYVVGAQQSVSGGGPAVFPSLQRAVELDPDFALAHCVMAIAYHFTGRPELAAKSAAKAYALRERVSEYEKLRITNWYHALVTGDLHKRLEALTLEKQIYPGKWAGGHADSCHTYILLGEFERALVEARAAIRIDPHFSAPYSLQARALLGLNRFAEARDTLTQALQQKVAGVRSQHILYQLAFIAGDTAEMQRQVEPLRGMEPIGYLAHDWQASTAAFAGQWRKAQEHAHRLIELTARGDLQEVAARYATEQALRGALFGDCRQAKVDGSQGLRLARGRASLPRAALALALCGELKQVKPLIDELTKLYPEDTLINSLWLPLINAAIALQGGNATQAIEQMQTASRYEAAAEFWPQYLRGQAYLQLGRGAEAAAEFQKILANRGQAPLSVIYPLAYRGLARAAALSGETAQSQRAREDFLAAWKNADPDLALLREGKVAYGKK